MLHWNAGKCFLCYREHLQLYFAVTVNSKCIKKWWKLKTAVKIQSRLHPMSFNRFLNTHLFRKSEENLTITTASLIYTFFSNSPKSRSIFWWASRFKLDFLWFKWHCSKISFIRCWRPKLWILNGNPHNSNLN